MIRTVMPVKHTTYKEIRRRSWRVYSGRAAGEQETPSGAPLRCPAGAVPALLRWRPQGPRAPGPEKQRARHPRARTNKHTHLHTHTHAHAHAHTRSPAASARSPGRPV